jgi:hypothetical protein
MLGEQSKMMIRVIIDTDANLTEQEKSVLSRMVNGEPQKVELLKAEEACQILGCVPRTLRKYELAGRVQAIRQSKRKVRYRRDEIETLAYSGTDKL